ncbi:uncharacterized protein LOC144206807 isoform X2 [Stigmatopora nigra]
MHGTQALSRGSDGGGPPPRQKQVRKQTRLQDFYCTGMTTRPPYLEQVMKDQEAELVAEIEKLQRLVAELKTGFSDALLELAQIHHGDSLLRDEMDDHRRHCGRKARRSEALAESLRVRAPGRVPLSWLSPKPLSAAGGAGRRSPSGAGVARAVPPGRQERSSRRRAQPDTSAQESYGHSALPRPKSIFLKCVFVSIRRSEASRGKAALRGFLQGLKAGLCPETDLRHQAALQLLHSEWHYVSSLKQLFDTYKTTSRDSPQPQAALASSAERLLRRHLLFGNNLRERLNARRWKSLLGDLLVQLVGQNDTSFSEAYVGYSAVLASLLSLDVLKLDDGGDKQVDEVEALSQSWLLLAPVSRLHGYLAHIQNLLQRTDEDHPDRSLLLGTQRTLGHLLWRCHAILDQDVHWEEPSCRGDDDHEEEVAGGSASDDVPCRANGECAGPRTWEQGSVQTDGELAVERWPRSPSRRPRGRRSLTPEPPSADACYDDDGDGRVTPYEDDGDDDGGDGQVPVLLRPSERSARLRWEIPERTCGKTLNVRTGSPPLRAASAFRPIWERPSPENQRRSFPASGVGQAAVEPSSGRLWDDSEDSEAACSTV